MTAPRTSRQSLTHTGEHKARSRSSTSTPTPTYRFPPRQPVGHCMAWPLAICSGTATSTSSGSSPSQLRPDRFHYRGVRVFDDYEREQVDLLGIDLQPLDAAAPDGDLYLHVDLDVLDPVAFASRPGRHLTARPSDSSPARSSHSSTPAALSVSPSPSARPQLSTTPSCSNRCSPCCVAGTRPPPTLPAKHARHSTRLVTIRPHRICTNRSDRRVRTRGRSHDATQRSVATTEASI